MRVREIIELETPDSVSDTPVAEMNLAQFGIFIFRIRHKKGMKIKDVALSCGTHPTTIKNLELGISAPNPPAFDKIAEFFGIALKDARKVLVRDKCKKVKAKFYLNEFEKW